MHRIACNPTNTAEYIHAKGCNDNALTVLIALYMFDSYDAPTTESLLLGGVHDVKRCSNATLPCTALAHPMLCAFVHVSGPFLQPVLVLEDCVL
jgi:hypothetical protein